jgi:sterol 3beta-glucosyltransferase
MNITILSYGSRGDVEPFLALSKGLVKAGHRVRLAGPETYRLLFQDVPLEYIGLPGDPQKMVDTLINRAKNNRLRMVRSMSEFVLPLAKEVTGLVNTACRDAELIIHAFLLTSSGYEAARERGIPDISVQFFPVFAATSQFPAPTFPDLPLGGFYRRLTHELVSRSFWQGSRFLYRIIQKNNPDFPDLSGWPFDNKNSRQTPILYAFSSAVVPRPGDWPDHVHLTGYWFPEDQDNWIPDQKLTDFLQEGPPPIAVAFGSTSSHSLAGIYERISRALILSGQRGILVGPGPQVNKTASDLLQIGFVPYGWLFKRCAVVIHHGGAGTTGQGLAAGVPNIVLPFTSDQPFWGRRVYQLGAGPKPLSPRRFTSQQLAGVIRTVLDDPSMKGKARELGQAIQNEAGVSRAISLIERCTAH